MADIIKRLDNKTVEITKVSIESKSDLLGYKASLEVGIAELNKKLDEVNVKLNLLK